MRKPRARSRILKNFPARLEAIARKKALDRDTIEIWFADEARIGQKNKITRRWAKRGSYDDLVDHCCAAWNKLVDQPWRIISIGLRQWTHGF